MKRLLTVDSNETFLLRGRKSRTERVPCMDENKVLFRNSVPRRLQILYFRSNTCPRYLSVLLCSSRDFPCQCVCVQKVLRRRFYKKSVYTLLEDDKSLIVWLTLIFYLVRTETVSYLIVG